MQYIGKIKSADDIRCCQEDNTTGTPPYHWMKYKQV